MAVAEAGKKAAPRDVRAKFYRAAALIVKKEEPQEAEDVAARIFEERAEAHGLSAAGGGA